MTQGGQLLLSLYKAFRTQVARHWLHALRRRSQRDRMRELSGRWLPMSGFCISGPSSASASGPKARAQCVSNTRWELGGGGRPVEGRPYFDRGLSFATASSMDEGRRGASFLHEGSPALSPLQVATVLDDAHGAPAERRSFAAPPSSHGASARSR